MNPNCVEKTAELPMKDNNHLVVPIPGLHILPGITVSFHARNSEQANVFRAAWKGNRKFVLASDLDHGPGIGCLIEIIAFNQSPGLPPTVLLRGNHRVQMRHAEPFANGLQVVETANVRDYYPHEVQESRIARRQALVEAFFQQRPYGSERMLFTTLLERELPFGGLCDLIAYSCNLSTQEYTAIISQQNVDRRYEEVLRLLKRPQQQVTANSYRPPFSQN